MAQITTEQYIDSIQKGIMDQLVNGQKALPEGFNKDRFVLNCITVIRDMLKDEKQREKLQKVDVRSIPVCMAKAAFLGLDFFNGECYAIPYGKEMKFQTDYKGEVKLVKRFSKNPIKDVYAKVVREGDTYVEEILGGVQNVTFRPKPFSNTKMVGAFAIITYPDGSILYDSMSAEEIESVRDNYSKAANSKAWVKSTGEMYKKTVLRRLCKMVDLEFNTVEQIEAYRIGGDVEFKDNSISGSSQEALTDKGEPTDVFQQMNQTQAEKVPAGRAQANAQPQAQAIQPDEEEFRRYEQQMNNQSVSDDGSDFIVPDSDDNLPWN